MTEKNHDFLRLACRCGQVQGRIAASQSGQARRALQTHLVCYCGDCQTFAGWLGASGHALDRNAGTDLVQMTPDRLSFDQGVEQLACLQLRPKGLLRWYARCCRTPLCNTMARPFTSFVGVLTTNVQGMDAQEAFGPVQARAFTDSAHGPNSPKRNSGLPRVMFNVLRMILGSRLNGRYRITPFFSPDGAPVAKPHLLTPQALLSAREKAGIA
ncbi:DUF6151 family protein [Hydrogenophaga sp. 5NK40-0174]|uniref:DUF6151 family protein n=1 Tax=Hydrogenophaga sp. 5NK40-0174 TaxID=3127649 RepID=UPI0031083A75